MKKAFDTVAWMRAKRREIDEEDGRLSWEEKHEKTRQLLEVDPLWLRLKNRIVEPTGSSHAAAMKSRDKFNTRKPK
jgi:hypothetical protein